MKLLQQLLKLDTIALVCNESVPTDNSVNTSESVICTRETTLGQFLALAEDTSLAVGDTVIPNGGPYKGKKGKVEAIGTAARRGSVTVSFGDTGQYWMLISTLAKSKNE